MESYFQAALAQAFRSLAVCASSRLQAFLAFLAFLQFPPSACCQRRFTAISASFAFFLSPICGGSLLRHARPPTRQRGDDGENRRIYGALLGQRQRLQSQRSRGTTAPRKLALARGCCGKRGNLQSSMLRSPGSSSCVEQEVPHREKHTEARNASVGS